MTYAKNIAEWGHYPPVNHNILINPSFTVKQRGDVIDHDETTYGPDRWVVKGVTDVGGTMSQSSTAIDPTTGINKLVVKHRNATSSAYIAQKIEAVNLLGLYGKEMTFSFSYADNGGSGIPYVWIRSWDSSDTHKTLFEAVPTSLGNNRWTCTVTLTTPDGTIPDPNERGMQVVAYANERDVAPNEWSVWETKLEAGPVATPFIARSHGEELALCYRYYQYFEITGYQGFTATFRAGTTPRVSRSVFAYLPRMRADPSIDLTNDLTLRLYKMTDGSTVNLSSGIEIIGSNVGASLALKIGGECDGALVNNQGYSAMASNNGTASCEIDAEL